MDEKKLVNDEIKNSKEEVNVQGKTEKNLKIAVMVLLLIIIALTIVIAVILNTGMNKFTKDFENGKYDSLKIMYSKGNNEKKIEMENYVLNSLENNEIAYINRDISYEQYSVQLENAEYVLGQTSGLVRFKENAEKINADYEMYHKGTVAYENSNFFDAVITLNKLDKTSVYYDICQSLLTKIVTENMTDIDTIYTKYLDSADYKNAEKLLNSLQVVLSEDEYSRLNNQMTSIIETQKAKQVRIDKITLLKNYLTSKDDANLIYAEVYINEASGKYGLFFISEIEMGYVLSEDGEKLKTLYYEDIPKEISTSNAWFNLFIQMNDNTNEIKLYRPEGWYNVEGTHNYYTFGDSFSKKSLYGNYLEETPTTEIDGVPVSAEKFESEQEKYFSDFVKSYYLYKDVNMPSLELKLSYEEDFGRGSHILYEETVDNSKNILNQLLANE
ncbi:MAG: hypothetical protein ACK5LY_07280 [Lachnospirales bacterium]